MAELVRRVDPGTRTPDLSPPAVAAFIVTRGRPRSLRRCLESLLNAAKRLGEGGLLLRVLVNGSDELTERELGELEVGFARAIPSRTPAAARNLLLDQARELDYDWALFIDDDAYVPADYFERFLAIADELPAAAVIGGPNLTPPESNSFQTAAGEALSCRFGNYHSTSRYRKRGSPRSSGEQELILCNLAIRKDWVERFRFPETYVCAEENGLLQQLARARAEIYHDPELCVFHDRRENAGALARQVFKYGMGRGQNLRDSPRSFRLAFILPSLVLLAAAVLAGRALAGDAVSLRWLGLAAATYALSCLVAALRIASKSSLRIGWVAMGIFPVIHFSYAFGVLQGLAMGSRPAGRGRAGVVS